jgi:hypothetical protein
MIKGAGLSFQFDLDGHMLDAGFHEYLSNDFFHGFRFRKVHLMVDLEVKGGYIVTPVHGPDVEIVQTCDAVDIFDAVSKLVSIQVGVNPAAVS